MVMAVIHIICGNCGNADKALMEFKTVLEPDVDNDGDDVFLFQSTITCKNCGTIHFIDDEFGGEE